MKLLRTRVRNFRILRDFDVAFTVDEKRSLTVLRAENQSGKTTLMMALQWALYGDEALPSKGKRFRIHPIDWADADGPRAEIEVEVDFRVTRQNPGREGRGRSATHDYRIVRTAIEEVAGRDWRRQPSVVQLFKMTENGAVRQEYPEVFVRNLLPLSLREVFFTDGDRALSFIEADVATMTKRHRVQGAIQSLLGLDVIEACQKHIQQVTRDSNRQIQKDTGDAHVGRLTQSIEAASERLEELDQAEKDAREQQDTLEEKVRQMDFEIHEVLKRGDREQLAAQSRNTEQDMRRLSGVSRGLEKEHANLFRRESLAMALAGSVIRRAEGRLDDLAGRNEIPSGTVPVLEDCLKRGRCLCGDSLADDGAVGSRKRTHILGLVSETRESDEHKKILTELFFRSRGMLSRPEGGWIEEYRAVFGKRDGVEEQLNQFSKRRMEIEQRIESLRDTDVRVLRTQKRTYEEQRGRFRDKVVRCITQRENLERTKARDEAERDRILRVKKKENRILADMQAMRDIEEILKSACHRIRTEELRKVSDRMNELFIDMIGADPEQGEISVVKRAEISSDFDILVYGPSDRMLNPDQDLNGASRRALTLAFILGLTEISGREAPNIIDTPLGMMSGFVKRTVLRTAIRQSAQLILFLTRAEIEGCGDVLDESAGQVITMTNPALYPRILRNKPAEERANIIVCECDHRTDCEICELRSDDTTR